MECRERQRRRRHNVIAVSLADAAWLAAWLDGWLDGKLAGGHFVSCPYNDRLETIGSVASHSKSLNPRLESFE